MTDRLPACDRHHAGMEAEIVVDRTATGDRRRCKVCMRVRAAEAYHRIDKPHTTAQIYGVLPSLNWPPPQI